jgi:hypothetical protein
MESGFSGDSFEDSKKLIPYISTRTSRYQKSKSKARAKAQRRKEYAKFFLCFSLRTLSGLACVKVFAFYRSPHLPPTAT